MANQKKSIYAIITHVARAQLHSVVKLGAPALLFNRNNLMDPSNKREQGIFFSLKKFSLK